MGNFYRSGCVRQANGFTLAELLTVLLLLGIITTFTIPKILTSQQNAQRLAIFKETIAALNEAFYPACIQGQITDTNFGTYMTTHINAVKICPGNSNTQGCWNNVVDIAGQATTPGFVMHNGAMVSGFDNSGTGAGGDIFQMDWNGTAGPNIVAPSGSLLPDVMGLVAYWNNDTNADKRICTVRAYDTAAGNLANEIFR